MKRERSVAPPERSHPGRLRGQAGETPGVLICTATVGLVSQAGFAEAARISWAYLGKIERGEVTVTIATARKIAGALGMSLVELFGGLEGGSGASR